MSQQSPQLKIRKNLRAGELDAEADEVLMQQCFMDKGDVDLLESVESPKSVVVGRTGSGKTALLLRIAHRAEHSVLLDPNDISIRFLENSNIIQFLEELGIKLDLFYRLLWRHILTVELVKLRYDLKNEKDTHGFLESLKSWIGRDQAKKQAFEYFSEWGDRFWVNTDEHLKELTKKFSRDIQAGLKGIARPVELSASGVQALEEGERSVIRQRATEAVNKIQIKKLDQVVSLLSEYAFPDRQKKYYLLIDKLDEDWAETRTRCQFIRALIEEIKFFRKIVQLKIVAALRLDLLQIVFDETRGSGFQQEKYESLLLTLKWSRRDLKELVERRLNKVFEDQYTSRKLVFEDVFPKSTKHGGPAAVDYILERTLFRPRDALQYVNECFALAAERDRISWRVVYAAEAVYSSKRLNSLKEEWQQIFPALLESVDLIRGLRETFTRSDLTDDRIESVAEILCQNDADDPCILKIKEFYLGSGKISSFELIYQFLSCFYRIGAIGIKISSLETFAWSHVDQSTITRGEIKRSNQIKIHKMLHHSLEVRK